MVLVESNIRHIKVCLRGLEYLSLTLCLQKGSIGPCIQALIERTLVMLCLRMWEAAFLAIILMSLIETTHFDRGCIRHRSEFDTRISFILVVVVKSTLILLSVFHCIRVASWFKPRPNFIGNYISIFVSQLTIETCIFACACFFINHSTIVASCLWRVVAG